MSFLLSEIVARLGGHLRGEDLRVDGVQTLTTAGAHQLAFLANPKYRAQLHETQAGAVIVKQGSIELPAHKSYIESDDPYLYFARVAQLFHPRPLANGTRHPSAVIDPSAHIPENCEIGAHAVIGKNVRLGAGCRVLAGCVIEEDCVLGDECVLHPNVVLYPQVQLGKRVEIHSGSVIGADGFGIARDSSDNTWCKIPQSGTVIIGDDVEIGANSNIDRGALDNTEIGDGAKIDNQVQIGHNCKIGRHTAIAACTGISGSTKIGNYCIVGGAAMFVGHIEIADHTLIGGGTAVTRSITEAGHYATCFPLQTQKEWVKNAVHIRHLSDINKRLKSIEQTLAKS
ncbi:MAG: UDP-3-O-(3-hydroxymyristoyl)glucosamine N-acyltransferase [Neisseria sp.]|nr:UDP-3-O-(3-hydroxymyristoyl)glucosamine N-acyltransferase [Neisseria sp.]